MVAEAPTPIPEDPPAPNPLDRDLPAYLRLPNLAEGATPVRVGIILPLTSTNAGTRALAQSMLKAAQLAMFDARNPNMILMVEDEGNGGAPAASAARRLLAQGSEVIVGPLFGTSAAAVVLSRSPRVNPRNHPNAYLGRSRGSLGGVETCCELILNIGVI